MLAQGPWETRTMRGWRSRGPVKYGRRVPRLAGSPAAPLPGTEQRTDWSLTRARRVARPALLWLWLRGVGMGGLMKTQGEVGGQARPLSPLPQGARLPPSFSAHTPAWASISHLNH